ncbi:TPA: YggS family pyridoxal phosphate-dependent enzyme [Corynebacterium striatum]|uniref:YggS family pyridoxal phosphate-dependent enzyme n=1 Tax=Corynebacterium striatum TaxID=43770 RepID=UPI0027BA7531|nr:YggS family pyridoxal phosphate-dependent enzyme [Corynebacterium striatum]HCD1917219.1 YggS family pyridoxal phosphate-dependent enzyme [Corynebacterium striatum]HCD2523758.1 YggS family pyridoxal phosphate-dependent enzyme [Corynebacterium striatum]HCD3161820.1 YggS family pyridoxal phosphate-dependent enzyme [Corynebacterium striatum]HCD3684410.1 YggS family pyridoxal phosphate-dependent enzyme [Corynebacterium striatum]HCD4756287.1 YggS family pyridoxal phosphate-dependent enzyme [Coryn
MNRKEELQAGLEHTRAQIEDFARAAGREAPQLLPVTKFHPAGDVALLAELGVTDVAENREQEARAKAAELPAVRFHMIGQIQTKKANHVARWAHSVHSLDSAKLATALDRGVANAQESGDRDDALPVFIQVSADGDTVRGGVALPDVPSLVELVEELVNLELQGFMVVPPLDSDAAEVFGRVRTLTDDVARRLGRPLKMSAGMSADLGEAIAAGTDIVRVGTGIMGPRPVG